MNNKINVFDIVKQKVKIKDAVEYYTSTPIGRNNKCICPFHSDKNASLSILPQNNTFKCFGCGFGGSVVDFVMRYKHLTEIEAVKQLDADFNLNIPFPTPRHARESTSPNAVAKASGSTEACSEASGKASTTAVASGEVYAGVIPQAEEQHTTNPSVEASTEASTEACVAETDLGASGSESGCGRADVSECGYTRERATVGAGVGANANAEATAVGLAVGLANAEAGAGVGANAEAGAEKSPARSGLAQGQVFGQVQGQSVRDYILRCERDIGKTDYFAKRGLSAETIQRHRLGYDASKGRVIIPYSSKLEYYQARSTTDKAFFKPPTEIAGAEPLYNENAVLASSADNPIFVVESPICAMSIEQYHSPAIATCGGNGVAKLAELLKSGKAKTRPAFILAFDNDTAGEKFAGELAEFLEKKKIKFIRFNVAGKFKDPNECLLNSGEEFVRNIIEAKQTFYKQQTSYGDLRPASEILNMEFAETRWHVDRLFTNGVYLLCGASKSGKSWFVQQLCLAVAGGGEFLGAKTTRAECWYMAMEDDAELSQTRLKKMLQSSAVPNGFYISYEIYPMDKASADKPTLVEYIEANLKRNPRIKVLVIDTFQKIRSSALLGEGMFAHDYRDISTFKQIAEKHKICIIIVHHLNKMKDRDADGDPFSKINGTNGLMASADCILLLDRKRGEDRACLSFTGRKIGEDSWTIRQSPLDMKWHKESTAEESREQAQREEYENDEYVNTIRELLDNNNGSWTGTCSKILEECGKLYGYVDMAMINRAGRHINELTPKLKKYDNIIHIAPQKYGGKQGRLHTFYYAQCEQEQEVMQIW